MAFIILKGLIRFYLKFLFIDDIRLMDINFTLTNTGILIVLSIRFTDSREFGVRKFQLLSQEKTSLLNRGVNTLI